MNGGVYYLFVLLFLCDQCSQQSRLERTNRTSARLKPSKQGPRGRGRGRLGELRASLLFPRNPLFFVFVLLLLSVGCRRVLNETRSRCGKPQKLSVCSGTNTHTVGRSRGRELPLSSSSSCLRSDGSEAEPHGERAGRRGCKVLQSVAD